MTPRSAAARRVEDKIANAGVPSHDKQAPDQEKVPLGGQVLVNPLAMSYGEIRANFLNLTKAWLLKLKT